jgi:hypothetical protein
LRMDQGMQGLALFERVKYYFDATGRWSAPHGPASRLSSTHRWSGRRSAVRLDAGYRTVPHLPTGALDAPSLRLVASLLMGEHGRFGHRSCS